MTDFHLVCEKIELSKDEVESFICEQFWTFIPANVPLSFDLAQKAYGTLVKGSKESKFLLNEIGFELNFYYVRIDPFSLRHPQHLIYEKFSNIIKHFNKDHLCYVLDGRWDKANAIKMSKDFGDEYDGELIQRDLDDLPVMYEFTDYAIEQDFDFFWWYNNMGYIVERPQRDLFYELTQLNEISKKTIQMFREAVCSVFVVKCSEQGMIFASKDCLSEDFCSEMLAKFG